MNSHSRTLADAFVADFNRSAELYERYQVPFSDRLSRRLVKLAGISAGQDVLDIGTGTGPAALAAARLVGRTGSVTGIDVADGMLAIARRKASTKGLTNVRFEVMDTESLKFAGESFDAVISSLGIPTYCYQDTMTEALRVMRRGGTLGFAEVARTSPSWSLFTKALLKYRVKKAPPAVSARRKARERLQQTAEKFPLSIYAGILKRVGFTKVRTVSGILSALQPPSEGYLRYCIVREQSEYNAMPERSKQAFDADLLRGLEALRRRHSGVVKRWIRFWLAEKAKL